MAFFFSLTIFGAERCDRRDALGGTIRAQGSMRDVAALEQDRVSHLRRAEFEGAAIASAELGFAAEHVSAVAEHGDDYKRIGVCVPVDDRRGRLLTLSIGLRSRSSWFWGVGLFGARAAREVNMSDLVLHALDKV